eukprot:jgi/Chlat1/9020/Chrsp94S08291
MDAIAFLVWLVAGFFLLSSLSTAWRYRPGVHRGPPVLPVVGHAHLVVFHMLRGSLHDWIAAECAAAPAGAWTLVLPGLGSGTPWQAFTGYTQQRLSRLFIPSLRYHIISDVPSVERVLKTNFANYPKGQLFHDMQKDVLGDGIFAVDGEAWKAQRKAASYEFSHANLREFTAKVFAHHAKIVADNVAMMAKSGESFNLHDLFGRYTFDSILKIGFGTDVSTLSSFPPTTKAGTSNNATLSLLSAFDATLQCGYMRFYYADFYPLLRALSIGPEGRMAKASAVVNEFSYGVVRARRAELVHAPDAVHARHDLLSRFILLANGNGDDRYLRDIIINFVVAGRDTTASALSWMFYMITQHPHVQEEIVTELERVVGTDVGTPPTYVQLHQCHYLHACFSETLRLYPSVPLDSHVALHDDVLPNGLKMDADEHATYSSYAMGRAPWVWGKDAAEFRPERWLANDEATGTRVFQNQSPFTFTAFHAGPRLCLGKDMAYVEAKTAAALLLRKYNFTLATDYKRPVPELNFVLGMRNGLHVVATPRVCR